MLLHFVLGIRLCVICFPTHFAVLWDPFGLAIAFRNCSEQFDIEGNFFFWCIWSPLELICFGASMYRNLSFLEVFRISSSFDIDDPFFVKAMHMDKGNSSVLGFQFLVASFSIRKRTVVVTTLSQYLSHQFCHFPDVYFCVSNISFFERGREEMMIHKCQFRLGLGCAIRFGEADHPGPSIPSGNLSVKFCITNPTCLMNKIDSYRDLSAFCHSHFIAMSETAATTNMQRAFSKDIRCQGYKSFWGVPVPPFRQTTTGKETFRGKASGVGLLAKFPTRKARHALPDPWNLSTRLMHCITSLGSLHIQIFVIYGKTMSAPDALSHNQSLLDIIMTQSRLLPLPMIVLGDFNTPISQFPQWSHLQANGFRSLLDLHLLHQGCEMPPTCMEATHPDMAIFSPELIPLIHDIEVLGSEWFATHKPVCFSLRIPAHGLMKKHIRFPRQFVELGLDETDFLDASQKVEFSSPTTFEEWGGQVEQLAHIALLEKSEGKNGLPKSFRGRCVAPKVVLCPTFTTAKKARHGDYEPSHEVVTIKTKRKVTQLRRIQSCMWRIQKYEINGPLTPNTRTEILQEWNAIVKCKAWGPPFLGWLLQFPEVGLPTWPLPGYDWLFQVFQLVRHSVDSCLAEDAKIFNNKTQFGYRLDKLDNHHKMAYKQVKGHVIPPLTEMQTNLEEEVAVVPGDSPYTIEIFGEHVPSLKPEFPVTLDGNPWKIIDSCQDSVTLEPCGHQEIPIEQASMHQKQFAIHPSDIAIMLNQFWQPIWQRDDPDIDFETPLPELQEVIQLFPAHPAIDADMLDVLQWKQAIKKQKSHSARGIDRISNQELRLLPQQMIASLAILMHSFVGGFPSWIMQGLTVPLPKTDNIPDFSQTRPITILAMVYHLWSSVFFKHAIRVLATWIPAGVTGLLPHRGAHHAAYNSQFCIERAKYLRISASGLTLDIQKCFNCIKWICGFQLLGGLGFPQNILRQWFLSLKKLSRLWLIDQQIFEAGSTTCGFPEGDVWSVLVMISIATSWVMIIKRALPRMSPAISAYADNWSWTLLDINGHFPALRSTLQFTSLCGLTIDFHKTWYWSTNHRDASRIVDMLSPLIPHHFLHRSESSPDLGVQMQYSGGNKLGISEIRFQEGLDRLMRLKFLPRDLSTKEILLETSIFPATFYGSEIKPPSVQKHQIFRSKTVNSLLGETYSASPAIALLCMDKLLDPEFHVIQKAILVAWKFLQGQTFEVRSSFFEMASQFRGNLHQVKGPASAFKFYLMQIGWQIDKEGILRTSALLDFPFLEISPQRIKRFLARAWQDSLVKLLTARHSLFGFPDISHLDTKAVLSQFKPVQRCALIREVSGGFQTAQQKSKWVENGNEKCEFCDASDSRRHRLLECTVGHDCRQKFLPLLTSLEDEGWTFAEFPVIHAYPQCDMIMQIHFQHQIPSIPETILNWVQERKDNNIDIHWFTDGSCQYPHLQNARFSAFNISVDLCSTDWERCQYAKDFPSPSLLPPSVVPVLSSRTPGEQDILRAELTAIAEIYLQCGYGTIHTDSQTSIHHFQCMENAHDSMEFMHLEHSDLLLKVWKHGVSPDIHLRKVKAHMEYDKVNCLLARYWCIGNKLANDQAQHASLHLCPAFAMELQTQCATLMKSRRLLTQVFQLHLELQEARTRAAPPTPVATGQIHTTLVLKEAYGTWTVSPTQVFSTDFELQFLDQCVWGPTVAYKTVEWLKLLRWPLDNKGPLGATTGISWIELAISFMLHHRMYLPLRRVTSDNENRVVLVANYSQALEHKATLSEFGTMMQQVVDNVSALIPQSVMPHHLRKKCSSIHQLGYRVATQGWSIRPEVPAQGGMVNLLFDNFALKHQQHLDWTPQIATSSTECIVLPLSFGERRRLAQNRMKLARKYAKSIAGG